MKWLFVIGTGDETLVDQSAMTMGERLMVTLLVSWDINLWYQKICTQEMVLKWQASQ